MSAPELAGAAISLVVLPLVVNELWVGFRDRGMPGREARVTTAPGTVLSLRRGVDV